MKAGRGTTGKAPEIHLTLPHLGNLNVGVRSYGESSLVLIESKFTGLTKIPQVLEHVGQATWAGCCEGLIWGETVSHLLGRKAG